MCINIEIKYFARILLKLRIFPHLILFDKLFIIYPYGIISFTNDR